MNQGMIELANLAARLASNFLVHSTILIVVALAGAKFLVKRTAARSLLLRWVLVATVVLPLVAAGMSYWGVSFLLLPLPEAKLLEPVETPQTVAAEPLGHHAGFEPPPPVEHTPPARVEPEHNPPGVPRSSPGPEPLLPDAMVSAPVAAPDVPGRPAAERKAPRPNAVTYAYAAFGVLWGAGALALLVHLAFCHASLARLRRAARAVSHKAILAELAELSRRKGVRPPSLLSSGRLRSPLLTGFLRPAIIVPESFPRGAPLRAVLLHELAHLARHDCLVNLLVRLLCAVAFFQPLVWLLARRMEEVSDEVADDVVLSEGVAPSSYARNLADWAERYLPAGRESHAGVGVIRFKSGVGRRVQRILDTARRLATKVSPTTALAIVLGVGVAAAIVAGCVGVGPQSPATGIAALAEAKSLTIERIVLPPPPAPVQVTLTDASEIAEVVARMPRKDSGFAVGSVTRYRLRFAMPDGSAREYSVDPDGRLSNFNRADGTDSVPAPRFVELLRAATRSAAEVQRHMVSLKSDKSEVRQAAVAALVKMGAKGEAAAPALVEACRDFHRRLAPTAVRGPDWNREAKLITAALTRIGRKAVPAVIGVIRDEKMVSWAIDTLAAIGPDATRGLVGLLGDPDPLVRRSAIWALAYMKPGDPRAVQPLIGLLEDKDAEVRQATASALGRLALQPDKSVPALIAATADDFSPVRSAAAEALEKFGPAAKQAVPALTALLADKDWLVRSWAASALAAIRPPGRKVVVPKTTPAAAQAVPPAEMKDVLRQLKLIPEQEAKAKAWLAKKGDVIQPAEFTAFLRTILDAKQRAILGKLLGSGALVAPPAQDAAWGRAANGLQCRFRPATQVVVVANGKEPGDLRIRLHFELRNVGPKLVRFPLMNAPLRGGTGGVIVTRPDGTTWGHPWGLPDGVPPSEADFIAIAPGKTVSSALTLTTFNHWYSTPGVYQLRFKGSRPPQKGIPSAWVGALTSNIAKARIVPEHEPAWGPDVEGIQVRLRADKTTWPFDKAPIFKIDMRNMGTRRVTVYRDLASFRFEVDARWYRWPGSARVRPYPLGPGRRYDDVSVLLRRTWQSVKDDKQLRLSAGKHRVRIAFSAVPADEDRKEPVRVVSNPVEIRVERGLPGGTGLSVKRAFTDKFGSLQDRVAFVAVCRAVDATEIGPGTGAIVRRPQKTEVIKVLARSGPGDKVIALHYSCLHGSPLLPGTRVIWIVRRQKDGAWFGVKALADTPENRKAVVDAAKATGALAAQADEARGKPLAGDIKALSPPAPENLTRRLKLTPEQEAKAKAWLAKKGDLIQPSEFAAFLRTILDAKQKVLLEKVLNSPTAPVPPAPAWGKEVDGLRAQLRAAKATFKLGEDVPVTLTIQNVSDKKISLLEHRDGVYGYTFFTRFVVKTPDGKEVRLGDPAGPSRLFPMRELSFPSARTLEPKETYEFRVILNRWRTRRSGLGRHAFLPGTYAIQADYSYTPKLKGKEVWTGKLKHKEVWTGTLLSNPLKITVMKQPAPHDPKKIRWGKVTKGVRYGLTFDKLIHGWFEPITGTVSVEAPGGPADVPETVAISCGGGYQHVPLTADPDALRRSRTLRLKKGERRTARFDLTFFAQRHGFPRPATMEFNAAWYPKMQAPRVLVLDLVHSLGRPSAAVIRGLVEVVRPTKATFTQGEPLVFHTTLRNVTKQPVLVYDAGYYPEWNHMITAADGKSWWRARRLERVDRVPPPPITLRPGGEHTIIVSLDGRRFGFLRTTKDGQRTFERRRALPPGIYQIMFNRPFVKGPDKFAEERRAEYWAGFINSRPVSFSVVEGKGAGVSDPTKTGPAPKPPRPTAQQRAELFKGTKRFRLVLQYHGRQPWLRPHRSLDLYTQKPVGRWRPDYCRRAVITPERAAQIIDHLVRDGFIDRSINLIGRTSTGGLGRPVYSLRISGPAKVQLREDLGWGLSMLKRLEGLREILDGDAADAMDGLLGRLQRHRKAWEQAAARAGPWGRAVNGLQSRIVLAKRGFRQGERIRVLVEFRNVSREPIRFDGRGGRYRLAYLVGSQERRPARAPESVQVDIHRDAAGRANGQPKKYEFPTIRPGGIGQIAHRTFADPYCPYYLRAVGKYRVRWTGTRVKPQIELAATAEDILFGDGEERYEAAVRAAKKIAVGLPPAPAVDFEVVTTPGGEPGGDVVARLFKVIPLGWQIHGIHMLDPEGAGLGKRYGRVSRVGLVHRPDPDGLPNNAWLRVYLTDEPFKPAAGKGTYLGLSPLGHGAITFIDDGYRGRWNYAAHDVARALGVAKPPPKPEGADWGRMTSRILRRCPALARAELKPIAGQELTRIGLKSNVVPDPSKTFGAARKSPDTPYYEVRLSVAHLDARKEWHWETIRPGGHIKLDKGQNAKNYRVPHLGVDIYVTVLTDDAKFLRAVNTVFQEELNRALKASQPGAGTWGRAVNGLQSRVLLLRRKVAPGERIEAKLQVRNAGTKPVAYDPRGWESFGLWHAHAGDVKPVPDPHEAGSIMIMSDELEIDVAKLKNWKPKPEDIYQFPVLALGATLEFKLKKLGGDWATRVPGTYRVEWRGTTVGMRYYVPWQLECFGGWNGPSYEERLKAARKMAVGLPPAPAVTFRVLRPAKVNPWETIVPQLQELIPLGWKTEGIRLRAKDLQGLGEQAGRVSKITLVHRPAPGLKSKNTTTLEVYVAEKRFYPNIDRWGDPPEHVGEGKLGHVYVRGLHSVFGRWNHAAHDIARVLGVQKLAKKRTAPDWGRVVSRILWRCHRAGARHSGVDGLLYRSALTPQGAELASIRYRSNAAPDARKKVSFVREDAKRPYYYVDLSVVPSPKEEGQQVRVPVEKSIKLGDAGTVACFAIKRLGVDVRITLRSDDPAFLNVVGAAVEAELNRALGAK